MSDYLDDLPLTKWFLAGYSGWHHSHFPGGGKYHYDSVLRATHDYLNERVHPNVLVRASLKDKDTFLTDHGPDHIKMVMRRAQLLISNKQWIVEGRKTTSSFRPCLEPYEVFLLLMAIHFHDVGNIYGREGHEKRIAAVMRNVPVFQALDGFEQGLIARIATCHGGTIDEDQNTISRLEANGTYGDIKYRPQLIAAVLRLADELAEDRSRADHFALLEPSKIPLGCVIFHQFAAALTSVDLDPLSQQVSLHFQLTKQEATATYIFKTHNKYLLDYIYERSLKTYRELEYCSRYMRELECQFHQVSVAIESMCSKLDFSPVETISFRIGDTGYPNDKHGTLETLAEGYSGSPSGEELATRMSVRCPVEDAI